MTTYTMSKCAACGLENGEDAIDCRRCGEALGNAPTALSDPSGAVAPEPSVLLDQLRVLPDQPRDGLDLTAPGREPASAATAAFHATDAPLAGWWSRVAALILDSVVMFIPLAILSLILNVALGPNGLIPQLLLGLGGVFAYYLLMTRTGENNGQTLGMQAMHIRVRHVDGRPVGVRTVVVRQLVMQMVIGLFWLYLLLDYLWPLWDSENRAIHDMVAKTRVVRSDVG